MNAPIEILVVDNDPASSGRVAQGVTVGANQRLRYFVNAENIGMFGNWNRCIELARGEWFAILNDDDLLDPDFARRVLDILATCSAVDALICSKRTLDQRIDVAERAGQQSCTTRLLKKIMFRGRRWRRITARHLFWGNVIGNSVGLICRTSDLRALGGFDPADYPSADYYVHARLATQRRLGQIPDVLASIRVAENESMKRDVLHGFLRTGYRMQQALAGRYLPAWWRRLSPSLIARHIGELSAAWHVPLDRELVARDLQIRLPADPGRLMKLARLVLGGL